MTEETQTIEADQTDESVEALAGADAPVGAPVLRRRELIQRVTEHSGLKKGAVRAAIDAVLPELAAAIVAGETVNLPGFGKLSVVKSKSSGKADIYHLRLRRRAADEAGAEDDNTGLADQEDNG